MKISDIARFTPLHWALVAVALVCAVVAGAQVLGGLGFRWDPLDLTERRADRAEGERDIARADAAARSAEVGGARDTTRLVERAAADRAAATEIVHRYAIQLEASTDEANPVPAAGPDPGDDLRDVVGQLCLLRPSVCAGHGDPAPARHARDGAEAVPDPAAPR